MSDWWRDAVLYQVYVRSFADSDGDGLGDLPGLRSRLGHIAELGVEGLWLTPFYPSPDADHGYDVSDYVDVDPRYGTLADFDALVADAHDRGLRVIVDVVPNHTSREHRWFTERPELYVWADAPNNWPSTFGGSAWTLDEARGRHYLHLFAPEQPDLDWHQPEVREEFDAILRFWLDRGVDGFRIDVAHALFKDPELRDEAEPFPVTPFSSDWRAAVDRPELHELYRGWRALVDAYPNGRMLVGEVSLSDPVRVADYVRPDELHLAFNFALMFQPWDAAAIREAIERTLAALAPVGATATWVLESHDMPRLATRYGGGETGGRRARAAALLLLALPGTAFVYQGQELGLEEVEVPEHARRDPVFFRTNGARAGRDGCRVPIPWDADAPGLGFTTGEPWLPFPDGWGGASVAAQRENPGSMLSLYRSALACRPHGAAFAWLESAPGTLAFARDDLACVVNLAAEPLALPKGEVVLASGPVGDTLPTDTAVWLRRGAA